MIINTINQLIYSFENREKGISSTGLKHRDQIINNSNINMFYLLIVNTINYQLF